MRDSDKRKKSARQIVASGANPFARVKYTVSNGTASPAHTRSLLKPEAHRFFDVKTWREQVEAVEREEGKEIASTTRIFRYLSKDRFLDLVCSHENAVAHISSWEDPLEGFVFKANGLTGLAAANRIGHYKDIFGQSWTLSADESDLRWRAYCPNADGVRIETTVGHLRKALKAAFGDRFDDCYVLGRVHYLKEAEEHLLDLPPKWQLLIPSGENEMVKLLFLKRHHFTSENEYRVICNPQGFPSKKVLVRKQRKLKPEHGLLRCKFGDELWIQSVLCDPRMTHQQMNRICCIMEQENVSCPVTQSGIYEWPHFGF